MHCFHVFIIIFLVPPNTNRAEEDVNYKIALPEYLCGKDGEVKEVNKDRTMIRLLGSDAQSLSYSFEVNYKRIGGTCKNQQRCTLITWDSIRKLNEFLKKYSIEGGLIEINNTMLLPGIQYIIKVTVVNNGTVIEENSLTLDYVDEDVRNSVKKPLASILLLGSDYAFAFANYYMNAEPTICSNLTTYYFSWKLYKDNELINKFSDKGSQLIIRSNTLQGDNDYRIQCELISNEEVVATDSQNLKVLKKGGMLYLPFKKTTMAIGQPFKMNIPARDLDNTGDMEVQWVCGDFKGSGDAIMLENGLGNDGNYEVSVELLKDDQKLSAVGVVEIILSGPSIDIEELENPVSPNRGTEIKARVYDLRSSCTLQWSSLKDGDYSYIDLNTVPGKPGELTHITLKEDLFLNELEEFSNGTIDKEHNLKIPPSVLKGDVKYLFELKATCPPTISDQDLNETVTEPLLGESLTVTAIVEIETNAPPALQALEVTPDSDEAFTSKFSFKTLKAEERDGPVLYKFGYKASRDAFLWSLTDVTNAEMILPYIEGGVQTLLEGCDNFGSCAQVLGPKVLTKLPIFSRNLFRYFDEKIMWQEYYKAFIYGTNLIDSFKNNHEVQSYVIESISNEIRKFLESDDIDVDGALNLIENIKQFNNELKLPESSLSDLIKLRAKLSDSNVRQKRNSPSLARQETSPDALKSYLEFYDIIIANSNDPLRVSECKKAIIDKIVGTNLCSQNFAIELRTLILSSEKLTKNSFNYPITLPFDKNSWNVSAKIYLGSRNYDKTRNCIGKAVLKDYLDKDGQIYWAEVYEKNNFEDFTIMLSNPQNNENLKCIVFNKDWRDCKVLKITPSHVTCSCSTLGFFYLQKVLSLSPDFPTEFPDEETTAKSTDATLITRSTTTTTHLFVEPTSTATMSTIFPTTNEMITNNKTTSYTQLSVAITIGSVIGIMILAWVLKILLRGSNEELAVDDLEFPRYAQLHNEEMLEDVHF